MSQNPNQSQKKDYKSPTSKPGSQSQKNKSGSKGSQSNTYEANLGG